MQIEHDIFKDCPESLALELMDIFEYLKKWMDIGNHSVPKQLIGILIDNLEAKINSEKQENNNEHT